MARLAELLCLVAGLIGVILTVGGCEGSDPGAKPMSGKGTVKEKAPSPLLLPRSEAMNRTAPETFRVRLVTSKGDVVLDVRRVWSPHGVDRFYNLVANGFYDRGRFFRIVKGWVVQFGLHGDPRIGARWEEAVIPDDPVVLSNVKGTMAFATAGSGTRTTQVYINLTDNSAKLDVRGFSAFAKVVGGMDVVERLFDGYGEGPPAGTGPDQERMKTGGNAYLAREFPNLDYIEKATIETAK
jgi:cyclophilin family peptidyl-prolyl cis-trans isomerase